MKQLTIALAVPLVLAACGGADPGSVTGPGTGYVPPADPARGTNQAALPADSRVIYLHHSTGGVIWGGGVENGVTAHNTAHGSSYQISERAFPSGDPYPWDNYPYDYWNIWIQNAGPSPFMTEHTLEILATNHRVIVWKHCYPVSGIGEDGTPDITSSAKTITNYKLQYAALKTKMRAFPDVRFLVWTGAALTASSTDPATAARARAFFTWVKETWDTPGDNIFVWDFFELETEGGDVLKDAYSADGGNDSHPSGAFAAAVAPFFVNRLVAVLEGRGDTARRDGRP